MRDGASSTGYHAEATDRQGFRVRIEPFTSYGAPSAPDTGRWNEWKPNDLSRAELDRYEAEIVALRPLFEEHARLDWATEGSPWPGTTTFSRELPLCASTPPVRDLTLSG